MKTYRTTDGGEYPEYTKFARYKSPFVTWIPLLIGDNRVRFYAQSTLVEVKSPFDSGMVYCYPAIPQNFDSGLLYTVEPATQPLTVVVTPEMAAAISHTSGVEIVVRKTVTVSMWHESMVA